MFDIIKEMSQDSFGRGMLCAMIGGFIGMITFGADGVICIGGGICTLTLVCNMLGIIK